MAQLSLPEPMIFGQIPEVVLKDAKQFAAKLLADHQHCIIVTDMRYSVTPTKHRNNFEVLARIWHHPSVNSCTHTMTISLGSDQDAKLPDQAGADEGTASFIPDHRG
jgi:hypothetical protein